MKEFDAWNEQKKILHMNGEMPQFREGEIWWCIFGVNIGYEIDGKNEMLERPVLVLKKHNKQTFFGIPLTSKFKENVWFLKINNRDKEYIFNFSQGRTLSAHRLVRRMGGLSKSDIETVFYKYKKIMTPYETPAGAGVSRAPRAN